MSQVTETICDQCGARKGESNHWFVLALSHNDEVFSVSKVPLQWEGRKDICGENCLTHALEEFLHPVKQEEDHYREVGMNNGVI